LRKRDSAKPPAAAEANPIAILRLAIVI